MNERYYLRMHNVKITHRRSAAILMPLLRFRNSESEKFHIYSYFLRYRNRTKTLRFIDSNITLTSSQKNFYKVSEIFNVLSQYISFNLNPQQLKFSVNDIRIKSD